MVSLVALFVETPRDVEMRAEWFEGFFTMPRGLFQPEEPARRVLLPQGAAGAGRAEEQPAGRRARWTCDAGPETNACFGRRVGTGARLRDAVRAFVMAHLSAPDVVLVLDEIAFLKKGSIDPKRFGFRLVDCA
ncbi:MULTISPECIES: hypothetical protein [Streptomyces]|uniref:hypothetical protein n=1 Tax=Streptomyces TaxID=1883 RepID=UPI00345B659B